MPQRGPWAAKSFFPMVDRMNAGVPAGEKQSHERPILSAWLASQMGGAGLLLMPGQMMIRSGIVLARTLIGPRASRCAGIFHDRAPSISPS